LEILRDARNHQIMEEARKESPQVFREREREFDPAEHLLSDFGPTEHGRINLCTFKSPDF
jgi:hypothetical protein